MQPPLVSILFIAIAVIFLAITFRDYLRSEGKLNPARRAWIRIALIFSSVGIGLYLLQLLQG